MTVEEWVELDPPVEIVLRRVKDGARIVFVATRDRYAELCNEGGVAVFSPKEVRAVIEAAKHEDAADVMDRVVDVKLAFPGTRFNGFNAPPGEGHTR